MHLEKLPHESKIEGRWVDATDFRSGDKLLLRRGTEATVETVRHEAANTVVYNFAVDELRCYAVGIHQILVHNSNGLEKRARIKGARMMSADDALEQLEEIEQAQQKVRQGKLNKKIDDITKSKQRANNALKSIKTLDDLKELE